MMSLFSSFDLFLYKFSLFSLIALPSLLSLSAYCNSFICLSFNMVMNFMSSFFSSLSSFKFKFFDSAFLSLMFFLAYVNLFSILPFYFSYTSQLSFNLFWGLGVWLSLFSFNLVSNIKHVLIHFIPEGTPIFLIWFLFFVELVSNIIRPLTLVVRLLANILAGHLLMILLSKIVFINPLAVSLYFLLNLVEFFVSMIQSYIFVTMICLYFSETH